MKATTAKVLQCICMHAPCTKLCVKTQSGLAMSTVLGAVHELAAEGWIECEQRWVPQGGKPHANLSVGAKRLWGAVKTGNGIILYASITADGRVQIEKALADYAQGVCLGGKVANLAPFAMAKATCYAHSLTCPTAVVSRDLWVYLPQGDPIDLGEMPSPMLAKTRLNYHEAFAVADPKQRKLLQQELSLWIAKLCHCDAVLYEQEVTVTPTIAAQAALYCLLHP